MQTKEERTLVVGRTMLWGSMLTLALIKLDGGDISWLTVFSPLIFLYTIIVVLGLIVLIIE